MIQPEWIERIKQGDREAFRLVYEHTVDQVFKTVSFLIQDKQEASDVVHEIYVEMVQSLSSYDSGKPFLSWLKGVVVRQTSNWNRKRWRRSRLLERSARLEMAEHEANVEEIALRHEQSGELLALLHRLDYKYRIVIVLRYYEDCPFGEIARLLQLPLGTAKSRHRIALDLIRRKGNFSVNKDAKPTEANARKEIQLQFKEAADQIERPEQLDLRMEQMMHFQVNGSNIRVVAGLPPNLNIDPGDIGRLKQIGPEIRSQLAPGEAVFVYISDLDDRTGQKKTNYSFTRICNPLTYADRNEWKTIIRDDYEHILLPTWLPGGFSFKHGIVQSEIGCSKENKDKYYDRLKEQTVKMKQNVTWAAVEPDDFDFSHTAPAIIYSNGYGDQIKVSYRSMRDGTITTLTPDADKIYCAELDVDIYWLKYGAIWMKHRHGKTHSYTLSASPAVSRVDLEKMVSHMK